MHVLVIENYPGTPLGVVGEALEEKGIGTQNVAAYEGEEVPTHIGDAAGLIILGGEQSAVADETHPFLPDVCRLIQDAHAVSRPVLGICLGSQLIARALGGRNVLDRPVEFGWHDVKPTKAGQDDPVLCHLGDCAPMFHWHVDTVELPQNAVHLAASQMTHYQAYRVGQTTYAIQFHFEASEAVVREWSKTLKDAIAKVQPNWPSMLEAEAQANGARADEAGRKIARAWVSLL